MPFRFIEDPHYDIPDLLAQARRLALYWCRIRCDADDVAQEAVLQFLSASSRPDNPSAYLFVVVRNLTRRRWQRDLKRLEAEAIFESMRAGRRHFECLLEIEQVLESMPERDRRLIAMVIEGESSRDIANVFGCKVRDVGQMVARARKKARALVRKQGASGSSRATAGTPADREKER